MAEGAVISAEGEVGAAYAAPEPLLSANPFHAGWAVAAATGRLVPKGAVSWLNAGGARLPVRRRVWHGRLALPHLAGLTHDHCFAGHPDVGGADGIAALIGKADASLLALARVPEDSAAHGQLGCVRGAAIVHTRTRACLRRTLGFDEYLEQTVRGKKRKELRRLRARLEEEGAVEEAVFGPADDLSAWTADFLKLEAAGWKGQSGTAMAERPAEAAYLRLLLDGAHHAGALSLFKLSLNGRPLAMTIGLNASDGGLYTYKIAHDPAYARYSPGVMAMLFVTRHVLGSATLTYADSCAKEGHGMIEQLWPARRTLHDWLVPTNAVGRAVTKGLVVLGKARRL